MWAFKQLWDKGLIYEAYRVMPYSWGAETPLSNFEIRLDDATRPRQDPALTVRFDLDPIPRRSGPRKILGLDHHAVDAPGEPGPRRGPRARLRDREWTSRGRHPLRAARPALAATPPSSATPPGGHLRGADLAGRTYTPLFPYFADADAASGSWPTTSSTTRTAPASCTWPPVRRGRPAGVRGQRHRAGGAGRRAGRYTAEVAEWAGVNVFEANPTSSPPQGRGPGRAPRHLRPQLPALLAHRHADHLPGHVSPGTCRSPTSPTASSSQPGDQLDPVPRPRRRSSASGSRAPATGRSAATGSGAPPSRCGERRPRLPAHRRVRSLDEIERDFGVPPHRPAPPGRRADPPQPRRPDRPEHDATRVTEVLDCWFESGSMPFAQVHYPFENKEWFDDPQPGRLHRRVHRPDPRLVLHAARAVGGAVRPPAFRNVICHGVVLDAEGRKLSKKLRNYPDPVEVMETIGSDAAALVPDEFADPARRRPQDRQGRLGHRRRGAPGAQPDLERRTRSSASTRTSTATGTEFRTDATGQLDRYLLAKTHALVEARDRG
jgi:isoleucyl-tRNA synthetase